MTAKPEIKDVLEEMLLKPNVAIVDGFPGSGKTFLCEVLCYFVLSQPHGYVISNVKLQRWDGKANRPFEAQYRNYLLASSFVGILDAIAEVLFADPDAHILVYLDELQNSLSSADWQGGLAKGFKRWLGLLRKFHVSFLGSTPRIEWLVGVLRDEEVGLLSVELLKDPKDLERYAGRFMDEFGLDYQHAAVINWPAQQIDHQPVHLGPTEELAVPEETAKGTGAVYFATGGVASLVYGKHPLTGRNVDFSFLLSLLDQEGIVPFDYPRVLYEYFRKPPQEPEDGDAPAKINDLDDRLAEKKAKGGGRSTKKGIKPLVIEMILSGANFKDTEAVTGCSEALFYKYKGELRRAGKVT